MCNPAPSARSGNTVNSNWSIRPGRKPKRTCRSFISARRRVCSSIRELESRNLCRLVSRYRQHRHRPTRLVHCVWWPHNGRSLLAATVRLCLVRVLGVPHHYPTMSTLRYCPGKRSNSARSTVCNYFSARSAPCAPSALNRSRSSLSASIASASGAT
uniref:Uncharacterized protein n=1 Tax=Cacopsylla melanoneura TaxID=428564 RepID=A0A8D8Y9D3_9HEMI